MVLLVFFFKYGHGIPVRTGIVVQGGELFPSMQSSNPEMALQICFIRAVSLLKCKYVHLPTLMFTLWLILF